MTALEWSQYFSHYKSMGIFPDAQWQLTQKSLVGSCQITIPFKMTWLFSLPARIKKIQSKMKELEWTQGFPHYNHMGATCVSVAMEIRVLIRSGPKPYAANPSHHWCCRWNLFLIGRLVSEIFMFESVDARTDARTDGRRLESHTISSTWAFGSGELKSKITLLIRTSDLNISRLFWFQIFWKLQ